MSKKPIKKAQITPKKTKKEPLKKGRIKILIKIKKVL